MAGLQRSEISFRRQGSSGLVWDDKVLSGELKKINTKEEEDKKAESKTAANGGGGRSAYRTVEVEPAAEPPSPKVSGCGVCAIFGKKKPAGKFQKRKHGHRSM